jgi:RNA polymerase sigma-70 factor (ECF subfamily)
LHYGPQVSRWIGGGFTFKTSDGARRFDGFKSAVEVHDAVHDVFRAAFEERARLGYSGLAPFEGYLFIIAKNVVLRRLRIQDRSRPLEEGQAEALPSAEASPEERVMREEQVLVVRAFLATLPEEDRRFVELRFSEQLPQNTVGDRLGWSRKRVRIKEDDVRERLVRFLKQRRGSAERWEVSHEGPR